MTFALAGPQSETVHVGTRDPAPSRLCSAGVGEKGKSISVKRWHVMSSIGADRGREFTLAGGGPLLVSCL